MENINLNIEEKLLEYLKSYAEKAGLGLDTYIEGILVDHIKYKLDENRENIKDEIYEESLRKIGLNEEEIENIVHGGNK